MLQRFALVLLTALPLAAATPLPPAPVKYVTDGANLLDDARERALNERLAQYDRDTSNQILVYVDRKLPAGTTIEEMGAEAIRTWKVGQAKVDNGAILFLFIDDRASRIEVGYGLEGSLTDARSKQILVDLRPRLRSTDYIGAAEQGADAIIATLSPARAVQRPAAQPREDSGNDVWIGLAFVAFIGLLVFGFVAFIVWIIVRIVSVSRHSAPADTTSTSWLPSVDSFSSSSSSSDFSSSSSSDFSSSSSSDSSSFSGGGGSGGGGGASDSW